MKKQNFSVVLCMLILCTSLVACDSSDYKEAEKLYSEGDYNAALELYTELGEYEDSQEKVKMCKYELANISFEAKDYKAALEIYSELLDYEDVNEKVAYCEREIGMTENADYDFLADIEASVLDRMAHSDYEDYSTLVNTELAYLEKYSSKTFYDEEIQKCAEEYIDGLLVQKASLKEELYCDYQIEWLRGAVMRYTALKTLYEKYDFLSDNPNFIGQYISQYDDIVRELDGYYAIEEDIDKQTSDEDFTWWINEDEYSFYCTLVNNTEYTFGTYFDISFWDEDGVMFDTQTVYIDNIRPNTSYMVEVYVAEPARLDTFTWQNYYEYVE